MRSLRSWSHIWNGTSTAATKAMPAAIMRKLVPSRRTRCAMPASSGSEARERTAPLLRHITHAATPPTTTVLMIALSISMTPCADRIRVNPFKGSMRPKSGMSGLKLNNQPSSRTAETMPANTSKTSRGEKASTISAERSFSRSNIKSVSNASARSSCMLWRIMVDSLSARPAPMTHNPMPAVSKSVSVDSSRERATCPSSRACSRRRTDAGSVRSSPLSSAICCPWLSRQNYQMTMRVPISRTVAVLPRNSLRQ